MLLGAPGRTTRNKKLIRNKMLLETRSYLDLESGESSLVPRGCWFVRFQKRPTEPQTGSDRR